MAETDSLIGAELAGCKIIQKLGMGGMGSAYKAQHTLLDKTVCIKILSPALAEDERYVQFFLREARSVAKVDHPNIVQVYNVGKEKNTYFILMGYIDGKPLSEMITQSHGLPLDKAVSIFAGILRGLSAAHAQSIIHRDIKPSNILITREGEPKIVDFGIARQVKEEKQLTISGEMVGTAYFMAPEQGLGHAVDHRVDLYSAGVTLYYMLTAKYPFEGKTSIEVIHKHVSEPPPNIIKTRPEVPLWLSAIIERLMKKKPEERFQSANDVLELLAKNSAQLLSSSAASPEMFSGVKMSQPQAQDAPKPAAPPKDMPFSTKEDIREVSSRVPEIISFDDMMREEFESSPSKPASPSAKSAPSARPGLEAGAPPRPLRQPQQPGPSARPAARGGDAQPRMLVVDNTESSAASGGRTARERSDWSSGHTQKMLLLAFCCILSVFMAVSFFSAGALAAQKMQQGASLLTPWLSGNFMSLQWCALAGGTLLLAAALYTNSVPVLSYGAGALYGACLLSYKAGLAASPPGLSVPAMNTLSAVLRGLLENPGGHANLLVYCALLFFMASYFMSRDDTRLAGRWTGAICAVTAVFIIWHFSYIDEGSANNSEALNAALFLSVFLLVSSAASGFLRKASLLSQLAPSLLLAASMGFAWVHGVSKYAQKVYADKSNAQEAAITRAYALRQEQLELQRRQEAYGAGEVISTVNERGEIEQHQVLHRPDAAPAVQLLEIPQRRPLEALKSEAWRYAVREPFRRFRREAGRQGSYFLAGLLLLAAVFFSFAHRLRQEESSARMR